MITLELPPKTSRRQNQMKVNTDYTPSESDKKLKAALIEWRGQVHAEFWGGKRDHFLSPVALVSDKIIKSLCHLSHAHTICTIDDIANNIQGAQHTFVMKHAKSIIDLIHSIIPLPQTPSSVLDQESLLPLNIPVEPNVITAPKRCRWDISLVSNPPIGTSFGPWNISQSLPVKGATTNAFFVRIYRNPII